MDALITKLTDKELDKIPIVNGRKSFTDNSGKVWVLACNFDTLQEANDMANLITNN